MTDTFNELPNGEHKCVICFLMIDTDVLGNYVLMGNTPSSLGHVVCMRCRDLMDKLEDSPTHCRMCPGYNEACGIAWDAWKQQENFFCFDCFIKSCEDKEELIKQLCDVFARKLVDGKYINQ
jgi:hypothetical protein